MSIPINYYNMIRSNILKLTDTLDNLGKGIVATIHVPTGLQITDIPTKRLPLGTFQDLVGKLGMNDIHFLT